MGCDHYEYMGTTLLFDELDDESQCLCTFPRNDRAIGALSNDRIRSLAYLGAAVALCHHDVVGSHCILPSGLPDDIRSMIDAALPLYE